MLSGKHILLGVSGGIAAYKSALLVREFVRAGAEVQVVMTPAATRFITPLTLGTLSRRNVIIEMFPSGSGEQERQWTAHIDCALWAHLMLVAPATADTLAGIAHGFAGTFLAATALALRCPLAVAPSMDVDMYRHPATQENLGILRRRGVHVLEPEEGELASGLVGAGRLPEPAVVCRWVEGLLAPPPQDFLGRRLLVTAGPTHEPIDPVRFIGNRSSGKTGFALAAAAAERGAHVTLIAGPVHLPTPPGVHRVDVTTGREMYGAVMEAFPQSDALIMSAAVADFTPAEPSGRKIKKEALPEEGYALALIQNPDILKAAARSRRRQVLVGFALETENGLENARAKLSSKNLDLVVLNNPLEDGAGFGTDTNIVTLISAGGNAISLPKLPKTDVAHRILDAVAPLIS
jgi:phosphopantothenoylcysteine decarboxylase/phosphopantothenate--cysteine ligase